MEGMMMPDILATAAPLEIHTERVRREWIDHNGHMNVAYYLMAFDEAAGAVSKAIGYTNEYRKVNNIGTFVGDYH
ncbi:MAG: thioesterase family protein, partial [Pseudomonadota bacterium]|nr:thioesterase family protein [Pseudomonadota bacterium]